MGDLAMLECMHGHTCISETSQLYVHGPIMHGTYSCDI